MKIAFLAPYSKQYFYHNCGVSDVSVKGKDVWFFKYVPDRSIEVDIIGCLASFTYKKRVPFVILQIISFLPFFRQYDVVISSGFLNGVLFATARKVLRFRRPAHVIIDTRAFSALESDASMTLARFLLSRVDGVICLSQAEQALWEKHLGFSGRATWAPFTIDTDFQEFGPGENQDGGYIFAGGSSSRDWPTLIAAAEGIDRSLVLVAGRDPASGTHGLDRINIPPNVKVLFDVSRQEFKALLSKALVVVVPLKHVPFAIGTEVIGQAMACGKPVVATRIPTVIDYIRHGETGLLVEPGDVTDLRDKILFLLHHPEEAKRIATNARMAMTEERGEKAMGQRVWAMLQKVCASGGNRQ